jgi:hypothetical protein
MENSWTQNIPSTGISAHIDAKIGIDILGKGVDIECHATIGGAN